MYVAHIESISSACIIRILRRECISLYVAVQKDLISDLKKKKSSTKCELPHSNLLDYL